ncbi:MAG: hypothetical protein ACI4TX_00160 [Christensenellales bacterium]
MNIVCRKTKCKYNNNQACMSPNLLIDRELNCEQYEPIEKNSLQDVSKNMMEVAPEIAPFKHNKDIDIKCLANCVFNDNGECKANGIFVNGQTAKLNQKVCGIVQDDEGENLQQNAKCLKDCKNKKGNLFNIFKKSKNVGDERVYINTMQNVGTEKICSKACKNQAKEYVKGNGEGDKKDLSNCSVSAQDCKNKCNTNKYNYTNNDLKQSNNNYYCNTNKKNYDCKNKCKANKYYCKNNNIMQDNSNCKTNNEMQGNNNCDCFESDKSGEAKCFTFASK